MISICPILQFQLQDFTQNVEVSTSQDFLAADLALPQEIVFLANVLAEYREPTKNKNFGPPNSEERDKWPPPWLDFMPIPPSPCHKFRTSVARMWGQGLGQDHTAT